MSATKPVDAGTTLGQPSHAVIWIDHNLARILHFDRDQWTLKVVHSPHAGTHLHHKANSINSGHASEDQKFLHEVARAVGDAPSLLVTGPSNEKGELVKHIERHDPALGKRIAAVQPLDHPSDGELLAHARAFFHGADQMHSQI